MLRILLMLLGALTGLAALLVLFQNKLLYFPVRYLDAMKPGEGRTARFREFTGAGQPRQWGCLIEPGGERPAPANEPAFYIVFGGNGSSAWSLIPVFESLARETGCGFFLVDYPGYGFNEGKPTEAGIVAGALAAYDMLEKEGRFAGGAGVIGMSLGGGAAFALAESRRVARLVAISTFTSIDAMAREYYPWPLYHGLRNHYPNDRRLAALAALAPADRPGEIVLFHGRRDDLIPFKMAESLAALAPGYARLIPLDRATHNDALDLAYDELAKILSGRK